MSELSKFLKKFTPEYRSLADALLTVVSGIALDPKDRDAVHKVIHQVKTGADAMDAYVESKLPKKDEEKVVEPEKTGA